MNIKQEYTIRFIPFSYSAGSIVFFVNLLARMIDWKKDKWDITIFFSSLFHSSTIHQMHFHREPVHFELGLNNFNWELNALISNHYHDLFGEEGRMRSRSSSEDSRPLDSRGTLVIDRKQTTSRTHHVLVHIWDSVRFIFSFEDAIWTTNT